MRLELFRKMVLGGSTTGSPPAVNIAWGTPDSGTANKVCTKDVCNYQIVVNATDADNDIISRKVELSVDNGNTWTQLHADVGQFTDGISNTGSRSYRSVVTDSDGSIAISNILRIEKILPSLGKIKLVIGGVEYNSANEVDPRIYIPFPTSSNATFYFKNTHSTGYVKLSGVNPPIDNNAMTAHKFGNMTIKPTIVTSPQGGDTLFPTQQVIATINTVGHAGQYVINLKQVIGQYNGQDIFGELSWYIQLGLPIACKQYQIIVNEGSGNMIIGTYNDCNGLQQSFNISGDIGNNTFTFCAGEGTIETSTMDGSINEVGLCPF